MNPNAILVGLVALAVAMGGSYWQGRQDGAASVIATQSKADDSAQKEASHDVAQAKTESVKTITKIKTITREVPVYRDAACVHDERVFDTLNGALSGAGVDGVPAVSGGASGPHDGGDDGKAD